MDEQYFEEVWEIVDRSRRHPHRLSEIQEETISFGPESGSSSKQSSDGVKHEIHKDLPQIRYDHYGKAPPCDVAHESSDSQAISPEVEDRHRYSFDYDICHLHYEHDIEYLPLHATIRPETPIYEEVPVFELPPEVDLHRIREAESIPLVTRPIYYEPQEYHGYYEPQEQPVPARRTYGSFSSFSSESSCEERQIATVTEEQPAKSAVYDRPPFYEEPVYARIEEVKKTEKPPKLPDTPPPARMGQRLQPIERLEREPEFAQEVFNIYDTIYRTITEHHHERPVPELPPQPVKEEPKVVECKEPTYKFPNVRQMADEYSRTHEHRHAHVHAPPRLQRLYRDQEFEQIRFEPARQVVHVEKREPLGQKIVHIEKREPLGQKIVRPIEIHRHTRRDTLEFETASDLEYS